ncbi:MAG: hypothetical protein ACLPQY_29900 [Streptosporangiaceae bacterium]
MATAARDEIRASDCDAAGVGPAAAGVAAAGPAAVTGGGVLAAGWARLEAGVARAGDVAGVAADGRPGFTRADVGPAEAGAVAGWPRAACWGPDDWLIRTLTEATTAAKATTPASTVMEARKLISSIRVYMPSRKADSPLTRVRRGRRHRARC